VPLQLMLALSDRLLLDRIGVRRLFPRRLLHVPFVTSASGGGLCVELALRAAGGLINQLLKTLGLPMQGFTQKPAAGAALDHGGGGLAQPGLCHHHLSGGFAADPRHLLRGRADRRRWALAAMFWRITLPLLNPVIVYLSVLQTIEFLRMFDLVQQYDDQGGPLNRTTTVVLEVYNEGFPATTWATPRR
jgi:multiple sugar transport system permease protein